MEWRDRGELHHIELPAFPGVLLPAVFLPEERKLYFPVAHVCAALEVQDKRQREKVKRDYPDCLDDLTLPTTKGDRLMVCIEWEALGAWLTSIQEERIGPAQRERLRIFKRQVWRAASEILIGLHQPAALPAPDQRRGELAGLRSLALQTERRVGRLERVVFLSDEEAEQDSDSGTNSRLGQCPHCGKPIRVILGNMQIVSDED